MKIDLQYKTIDTHNIYTFNTNISYSSHYYYISRSFARKSQGYGFFN